MSLIRGAIFFFLLLAGIAFAVLNDQPVSLRYYFGWVSPPLPLFLWAFLFLLLGLVLSSIWAFVSKMSLRSKIRQRKRTLAELEQKQARMAEEKTLP
jgi:uncharacterized integral membrane protein